MLPYLCDTVTRTNLEPIPLNPNIKACFSTTAGLSAHLQGIVVAGLCVTSGPLSRM
jgi:hypothetical protein